MTKIEIKYKPRWWFFRVSKKVFIPETQSELKQRHILALLDADIISQNTFIARYCGISKRMAAKLPSFFKLKIIDEINQLTKSRFAGSFYINKIKCGKQWLYAPGEKLKGVSFGQFIFIDAWFNDPDPESINKFIAHLYLPANTEFNEDECLKRASVLKLDSTIREAIALNYSFFYQYFQDAYPLLFIPPSEKPGNESISKYDPRGWLKVYEQVRGDDIINDEKYAGVPVNTMLRYLNESVKQQAKTKHKSKAN